MQCPNILTRGVEPQQSASLKLECLSLSFSNMSRRGHLPSSLKRLSIRNCPKIESIVERFDDNSSLERIQIENCKKLESLPKGLHTLSSLRQILIRGCASLLSFPDRGLPDTAHLEIIIDNGMHTPNSRRCLFIIECPSSKEGFPTSLPSLTAGDVDFYKHLADRGFDKVTSLTLTIDKCTDADFTDAECFPQEDMRMILPSSLTHLYIFNLPELKHLSFEFLQDFTSLEGFYIHGCPEVESLPELPSSLKSLSIHKCPSLTDLPRLPSSLEILYIFDCALLKKKYRRDEGKEWSKKANNLRLTIFTSSEIGSEERG